MVTLFLLISLSSVTSVFNLSNEATFNRFVKLLVVLVRASDLIVIISKLGLKGRPSLRPRFSQLLKMP